MYCPKALCKWNETQGGLSWANASACPLPTSPHSPPLLSERKFYQAKPGLCFAKCPSLGLGLLGFWAGLWCPHGLPTIPKALFQHRTLLKVLPTAASQRAPTPGTRCSFSWHASSDCPHLCDTPWWLRNCSTHSSKAGGQVKPPEPKPIPHKPLGLDSYYFSTVEAKF